MTSSTVQYTVDEIRAKITTSQAWAERAIVRLYQEQTPSEQQLETTVYHNGHGFSAVDAEILSSFAKQIVRGYKRANGFCLTEKQTALAFKRLGKYAGQLYRLTYGQGD